jgi:integrase
MQTVIPPLTGPRRTDDLRKIVAREIAAVLRKNDSDDKPKRPKRIHGKNCAIVGNVTVPYCPVDHGWRTYWTTNGKRLWKRKPSREDVHKFAELIATQLSNGQSRRAEIGERDIDLLLSFKSLAESSNVSPQQLLWEISEYKQKFPAISLLDAGRAHQMLNPIEAPNTVTEIYDEMLPARKRDGKAKNTIDDWRSRIGRFTELFGARKASSISAKEISDWLRKLTHKKTGKLVSNRTRNNYRENLCAFFSFARESGYVPKSCNPFDEVRKVKNEPIRIDVFTPEQMIKLLGARVRIESKGKRKSLVPFMVIGGFCGVRHEEMSATDLPVLDWCQVDFEKKEIQILPEVARKIGRDRIVPMPDNVVAWLKPYAKPNGPVCELANANNALQETAAAAGIKWKDNGLRKTFISSRLALTKNIGQVAEEAGTSPERIRKNYKKTMPEREAKRYLNIWPTSADILQVEFGFSVKS